MITFIKQSKKVAIKLFNFTNEKLKILLPRIDMFVQNRLRIRPKKYIFGSNIYVNGFIFSQNRSFKKLALKYMPLRRSVGIVDPCYVIQVGHGNLGHFFHDQFFPLFNLWLLEKRKILVFVKTGDSAATKIGSNDSVVLDFIKATIGESWMILCNFETCYQCDSLILPPEGRDLRIYFDYKKTIEFIKHSCIEYYGLSDIRRDGLYIYPRLGLERKKLLGVDNWYLNSRRISVVEMHNLELRDQITILLSAKVFIAMVGAGVFNMIFMDHDASYVEINPGRENSWALRFGLSDMCRFQLFVSQNIRRASCLIQDEILDADVFFDDALKLKIDTVIDDLAQVLSPKVFNASNHFVK